MAQNYEIPTPKKRLLSLQIDPAKFEKATDEEKKQQDVMAESTTSLRTACGVSDAIRWQCSPLLFCFWLY